MQFRIMYHLSLPCPCTITLKFYVILFHFLKEFFGAGMPVSWHA